ncbi:hypothetical protein IMCC9480_3290 [Oxalobacteraceae bacterium IMCC9480]|nr:hypothetical protein IMCC9480_3290 [Oxalobacteraceae bacterium IMCC9480]
MQLAFDVDLRAFFQVLAGDLGELAIERDAVPFGEFFFLAAILVFPAFGGGYRDVSDGVAVGHVAGFRIAAEVADDDDFIDRCHGGFSWMVCVGAVDCAAADSSNWPQL